MTAGELFRVRRVHRRRETFRQCRAFKHGYLNQQRKRTMKIVSQAATLTALGLFGVASAAYAQSGGDSGGSAGGGSAGGASTGGASTGGKQESNIGG